MSTAAAPPDRTLSGPWPVALAAVASGLILLLAVYRRTVESIVELWFSSDTYAHGMLVVPIVLFMVWARRAQLAPLTPRASAVGLLALLGCCLVWLVAYTADVLLVQQFALVFMLVALVYAVLGGEVFRALLFPLIYLLFAVPAGESLVPPLQHYTAWFTVKALQLTGLPVLLEGFYITIPSKYDPQGWDHFHVAEACSGSRYLLASVALGCLYAYFNYRSGWRRLAFIALSVVVPIFANGVRAYGIVMIAHHSGMEYAIGVDHLIYGWVFFGLVVLLMFWIGSWWREPGPRQPASLSSASSQNDAGHRGNARLAGTAALALAMGATVQATAVRLHNGDDHRPVSLSAPAVAAPWQGPALSTGKEGGLFAGADAVIDADYRLDEETVHVYLAYYRQERQGSELINVHNRLFDPQRWRHVGGGTVETVATLGPVNELRLDNLRGGRLLWYWYRVAGRDVTSPLQAKLLRAWDQLGGLRKGSAVIVLSIDYRHAEPDRAAALLRRFLAEHWRQLRAELERAAAT